MSEPEFSPLHQISEAEDIGRFQLSNPLEIGAVLRQLQSRGDFLTVHFARGQQLLLTRLLQVDVPSRTFCFDWAGQEGLNRALLGSDRNVCVAAPDGVKVQFVIGRPREARVDGKPAFISGFPQDLVKLQRREFFRIETPMASPFLGRLMLAGGQRLQLQLHDLSLGGIGLWASAAEAQLLPRGLHLQEAVIELGSTGSIEVDLEVRSHRVMTTRSGEERFHIGCCFINLTRIGEATVQRLMAQLERERKALTG
ncbi:flagellar brake protein [Chitiniphilus purpureus]|uniref:Flagellar brake protein YcgR n=1 Tax=Chitiniphilus purpureus TaxID=2981137 RepID=A0ABY6DRY4_9NEIS|nr:flagellar brake protein [Chitiniphilus sp. CD1]UXY16787.1 flagellar brake protein [Chitiniphilus sp. CD1]